MRLTAMRNYAEKRNFIRMKVDTQITLTDPQTGQAHKGVCRDLSGTGMSIEVDHFFSVSTKLNTVLPSNSDAFPSFDTVVNVVRCAEVSENLFQVGVEIVEVNN